jgi:CDP-diacylglycerol---serine O-phosphatidyltransferase
MAYDERWINFRKLKAITQHIPNFLTCCNILCGVLAIIFPKWGLILILLGASFDFLDGFAARLLKAYSNIGKDLDSLADMVTFGVAPAILLYQQNVILALALPIFSALRLAKFNNDTRQTTSFLGLATPANGIFWAGIANLHFNQAPISIDPLYLNIVIALFCYLMISEIRMFSFKIKSKELKNIIFHLIFLTLIIILVIVFLAFSLNILFSLPIIVIIYIILSFIKHLIEPNEIYS